VEPARRREAAEQGDLRGRLHPISLDALFPATSRSRKARFRDPRWGSAHAERGRAADRARYQLPYIHVLRYRDGLHVSFNLVLDRLLMLEQLGLVPAPAALQ
jgi:hypothetical protein